MKKTLLTTAAIALLSAGMMAQTQGFTKPVKKSTAAKQTNAKEASTTPVPNRGCGTAVPTQQWDEAFNKMVEEHKQNMQTGRASATTYTIPIIFHIIH
ncbi:MAG TPA: hypothetical protein VKG26_14450, partial [Bacteroidia bacterium]|nr:hypothetical protein [Bacteroidia bacterium]